jgi:DNA-binding transcriptional ArsR family regulator
MAKAGGKAKAKKGSASGADDELIRALTHPLRREALRILNSSRKPMGPQEIEDRLKLTEERKEKLSSVSYHMRELARRGAVCLIDEEQVRGARKHLYISKVADISWVRGLLKRMRKSDEAKLWPKGKR